MTRQKVVGDLGEGLIERLLTRAGFHSIRDLNRRRYNHAGGDFLAKRAAIDYFISVKTRNKYVRGKRRLNGGYNLYPNKVRRAARPYHAEPAWVMIQIDTERQTFCAYFGTVNKLRNPQAIAVPMTPAALVDYECLAQDEFCAEILPGLSNQLPEHPPNLFSSSLGAIGPNSRLLKKGQFVSQKDNLRHSLAIQAKKTRDARQRPRKFQEELERERGPR
jgi:hypothetical protein